MSALLQQILSASPIGYWPMQESSGTTAGNLVDASRPAAATNGGGLPSALGPPGSRSFAFDGVDDFLNLGNQTFYSTAAWTWLAWVYPTTLTYPSTVAGIFNVSDSSDWSRYFRIANGGVVAMGFKGGDGVGRNSVGGPVVLQNIWNLAACRYDGTTMVCTANLSHVSTTIGVSAVNATSRRATIGGGWASIADWQWYGRMAHVAMFSTSLSDSVLKNIYEAGLRGAVSY